jgi:hypothetical protein
MKFDWETFTYDEEWLNAVVETEEQLRVNVEAGGKTKLVLLIGNVLKSAV